MKPSQIPAEWNDTDLITFEEFCKLTRSPQRTARNWRRRGIGPRHARMNGWRRRYITVAEARHFLDPATATRADHSTKGKCRD
jgi:hypothetical protein